MLNRKNAKKKEISIFWFRRDLRLNDNAGLFHALKNSSQVLCVYIFDPSILECLQDKKDRKVEFIHLALSDLQALLCELGSSLLVIHKTPHDAFESLVGSYRINKVYTNHDYEPYAIERDKKITTLLSQKNIPLESFKDRVIFEKAEVCKEDGTPYTVFTPYMKKWKSRLKNDGQQSHPCEKYYSNFLKTDCFAFPALGELGFQSAGMTFNKTEPGEELIRKYDTTRNSPALSGTSRMSVPLRFGTISIRGLVAKAQELNETFLNELIWREFYTMILFHFPRIVTKAFKPAYDAIRWKNDEKEFEKWCEGETGYPLVDAGMRELNATGFMHNRVRMVVASFLVKHLLIDWRWGEAYFAEKLLDYDLAANNGGWQWAAGCGCDAAPYFRVFNPELQAKRFDPESAYIKKWIPELNTATYPSPMVDHRESRERVLAIFKKALESCMN